LLLSPNHQPIHRIDIMLLALIAIGFGLFVISAQSATDFLIGDMTWYLNRAQLIYQGTLSRQFVYTIGYPILVGGIDLALNDTILSGIVANTLMLFIMMCGIYLVGILYFNRVVGWVAILLVIVNPSFLVVCRILEPNFTAMSLVIWNVLAFVWLVNRPSILSAVCLGLISTIMMYIRLEQGMYFALLPLALWMIYRKNKDIRQIIRLLAAGSSIFIIGFFFYAYIFISRSDVGSSSAFSFLALLGDTPISWELMSRRVTDMLVAISLHWSSIFLLIGLAVIILIEKYQEIGWLLGSIVILGYIVLFVLAIWPFPLRGLYSLPLSAILIAWGLQRLAKIHRIAFITVGLLTTAILLPNITTLVQSLDNPLRYQSDDLALNAQTLDDWLTQNGYETGQVFTPCGEIAPFSDRRFEVLFRLDLGGDVDAPNQSDSPTQLLPQLYESGRLLMLCNTPPKFQDWRTFLADPSMFGYEIQELYSHDKYTIYQIERAGE